VTGNVGEAVIRETIGRLQSYIDFYDSIRHNGWPTFYQSIRIKSLLDNGRIFLADDMGMGKTFVGVMGKVLLEEKYGRRPALIVSPKPAMAENDYLHGPWSESEINTYSSMMGRRPQKVVAIHTFQDLASVDGDTDFVVINYEKLSRDKDSNRYQQALMKMDFGLVDLDEVHNVKNPSTNRFAVLQPLIEMYRDRPLILSSGTIPANTLNEMGTYLWALDPTAYPNPRQWRFEADPEAVRKMLDRHQWFRITRAELKEELGLADLNDGNILDVELSEAEAHAYFETWKNCSFLGDKLVRLRQCEFNPALVPQLSGYCGPFSKRQTINRLIEQKVADGESVAVYLPLKTGIIDEFVDDNQKWGAAKIEGDTPYALRYEIADAWKKGEIKVAFLTSVMSEALDLSLGDRPATFIFGEPPFTPREYHQPPGRIWRRGQHAPVTVYYAITKSDVLNSLMQNAVDEIVEENNIPRPRNFSPRTISQDKMRLVRYKLAVAENVYKGVVPEEWERQLFETRTEEEARRFMEGMVSLPKVEKIPAFTQAILLQSMWRGVGEDGYRQIAETPLGERYTRLYTEDWDGTFSASTNNAIAKIIAAEEKTKGRQGLVADIGSAHGCVSQALYKLGTPRPTICVDIDPKMLQRGREVCGRLGMDNYYINAKATDTTLPTSSVDVVTLSYILHYLEQNGKREVEDALIEANRILVPDGLMISAFPWTVQEDRVRRFIGGIGNYGFSMLPLSGFYKAGNNGVHLTVARATDKVTGYRADSKDFELYGTRRKLSGGSETKGRIRGRKKFAGEEQFVRKDNKMTLEEALDMSFEVK